MTSTPEPSAQQLRLRENQLFLALSIVIGILAGLAAVLFTLAMVAIIVGVDFIVFKNRFWERLIVNVGIVLVFAAFYSRFLKRP